MKTASILLFALIFNGCAYFTVSPVMCDNINLNDPNTQNIPAECRDYNEEDAAKATYPEDQTPIKVDKDFQIGK